MSNRVIRQHSILYRAARFTVVHGLSLLFRWKVEAASYVPASGPCIIASNHIHNLDPFVIGASVPRFVQFLAKDELFHIPVITPLIRYLGAIPIRRGGNDRAGLRRAVEVPKNGGCLVIFPEGHRSKTGRLGPGKPGVALIARLAECPIVPCAVIGPYGFRKRLTVRFGPPLVASPDDTNDVLLDKLMTQIRNLYERGVHQSAPG
ncbi:MAG: 1-acyl-sn-glycerol-3-phosphate acyltransferase [Alicyclobacillus sp.]|nr:1-acyl-sn-glycerol-3-phosphate acyltransferase [Alicyclobacillus sp.]